MSRATILYLSPTAERGGAEQSLLDLISGLDRERFDPRLITLGDGPLVETARSRGVRTVALGTARAFRRTSLRGRRSSIARMVVGVLCALPLVWEIRRIAHQTRTSLIHSNGNKTHLLSVLATIGTRRQVVWHVRDFLRSGFFERCLVRLANGRVRAVIANSAAVGAHLSSLGVRPAILNVIPNGIDCARCSPRGFAADFRKQFGWPVASPVVGIVGALAPWKGHRVFLEAAKQIAHKREAARFVVVGDEFYKTDGHAAFRAELETLVRDGVLAGRVAFTGYRPDIPEVMRGLDVVVHASVEPEPFGRVVAEALACARPVIAAAGGGIDEITGVNGEAARLLPAGDAALLAAAMVETLDNREAAAARALVGRARIAERFDLRRHVASVEVLYERLVGSRKLRVLQVGKFYRPSRGGIETVLGELCDATREAWTLKVVVANDRARTSRESIDAVDVTRAASIGRPASVPICPTMPFHLWRERYDCVVLHEPSPFNAAMLWLWTPAQHLIVWHHSDIVRPRWAPLAYGWMQRSLYRRAACVIVSSPRLAASSPVVAAARRVAVIPFGSDSARSGELSAVGLCRVAQLRGSRCGPTMLFVGRLVYYKGLDVLLRAMASCPGTLVIIGEGPLERSLRDFAARLGIASRVEFIAEVSDDELKAQYHAADLVVLPSTERTEAFGMVQVEAMACGIPVVSTDLPTGVPWVNQHDITGLIAPPGDVDSLADAIRRLVGDPAARARMGEAGRRRVRATFSRERMVRQFRALVEAAVCGPAALDAQPTIVRQPVGGRALATRPSPEKPPCSSIS